MGYQFSNKQKKIFQLSLLGLGLVFYGQNCARTSFSKRSFSSSTESVSSTNGNGGVTDSTLPPDNTPVPTSNTPFTIKYNGFGTNGLAVQIDQNTIPSCGSLTELLISSSVPDSTIFKPVSLNDLSQGWTAASNSPSPSLSTFKYSSQSSFYHDLTTPLTDKISTYANWKFSNSDCNGSSSKDFTLTHQRSFNSANSFLGGSQAMANMYTYCQPATTNSASCFFEEMMAGGASYLFIQPNETRPQIKLKVANPEASFSPTSFVWNKSSVFDDTGFIALEVPYYTGMIARAELSMDQTSTVLNNTWNYQGKGKADAKLYQKLNFSDNYIQLVRSQNGSFLTGSQVNPVNFLSTAFCVNPSFMIANSSYAVLKPTAVFPYSAQTAISNYNSLYIKSVSYKAYDAETNQLIKNVSSATGYKNTEIPPKTYNPVESICSGSSGVVRLEAEVILTNNAVLKSQYHVMFF